MIGRFLVKKNEIINCEEFQVEKGQTDRPTERRMGVLEYSRKKGFVV